MNKIEISNFSGVSNTALLTLYCRAMDYQSKHSILKDNFSFDLYNRIEFDWNLVKRKLRRTDPILIGIRGRKFDQMCRDFLTHNPNGIIIGLGSGLDYRFGRIDNGQCYYVDLDLPDVLEFKKLIIPSSNRNRLIEKSVLDFSWIQEIKKLSTELNAPVFFIAEGLFIYLSLTEIQELFKNLYTSFPKAEIFFDMFNERAKKMSQKKSGFNDWKVDIKSTLDSGKQMEEWGIGFKVLSEWYFPEDPDAKRGWMKLIWKFPIFTKLQYFVHGLFD